MECVKFEELGLLYVSGELDAAEAEAYEAHLAECEDCRREVDAYKKERETLFTAGILGEAPSEAVDRELLRVCANPKKKFSFALMPLYLKKYAAAPVFLMLLMVAVGGYIRYHSMSAESLRTRLINEASLSAERELERDGYAPRVDYGEIARAADSGDSGAHAKGLGNLELEGVVTVGESREKQ